MPITRVIVRGLVQGVGFRDFVMRQAAKRPVEGWVRNRRDGSVEAVLSGSEEAVNEMLRACRHGPRSSRVDSLTELPAGQADLGLRPPGEAFSWIETA